jgi:hypothetical protein
MKTKAYKLREHIARYIYEKLCKLSDDTEVYYLKANSRYENSCFIVCGCTLGHNVFSLKDKWDNLSDSLGVHLQGHFYSYVLDWESKNAVLLWDKEKEEKLREYLDKKKRNQNMEGQWITLHIHNDIE